MDIRRCSIVRGADRVCYQVSGRGPAVLLGHALLMDGRMWDGVQPLLGDRFQLIIPDARGHRRSTASGPVSLTDLAEDWLAILDQEGIERAALVGLSMGGMTAMRAALLAPERVWALGLLDTSADAESDDGRLKLRLLADVVRWLGSPRWTFRHLPAAMFGATARREQPEVVARELQRIRQKDGRALRWPIRAVAERPDMRRELSRLSVATLVLVGEEDRTTPPHRSLRIAEAVPRAELHHLPTVGHLSVVEAPNRVGALLGRFLDEAWAS